MYDSSTQPQVMASGMQLAPKRGYKKALKIFAQAVLSYSGHSAAILLFLSHKVGESKQESVKEGSWQEHGLQMANLQEIAEE